MYKLLIFAGVAVLLSCNRVDSAQSGQEDTNKADTAVSAMSAEQSLFEEETEIPPVRESKDPVMSGKHKNVFAEIHADGWDEGWTLMNDGTIKELSAGTWAKKGPAIEIYSGEGTSYFTVLDGYLYYGVYNPLTGKCCTEEYNYEEGVLENVEYLPVPKEGTKLRSFKVSSC